MFETNTLQSVVQLDIDSEVVGIKFEFIPGTQALVFGHIHGQSCNGAIERQLPMLVLTRVSAEIDATDVLSGDVLAGDMIHKGLLELSEMVMHLRQHMHHSAIKSRLSTNTCIKVHDGFHWVRVRSEEHTSELQS